jgi:hypothetical protein
MSSNIVKSNLSIWDVELSIEKEKEEKYMMYYINECVLTTQTYSAFILDKTKLVMDIVEKLVFDLSKFYLNQTNDDIMSDNIYIEFWFKSICTYSKALHTDGDDESLKYRKISRSPNMSILLYLNDNDNPTLITNINEEAYKFKQLSNENKNICIVFPKKMRSIVFDGNYFHSEVNLFTEWNDLSNERNMLVIDIWKNYKPINLPLYICDKYKEYTYDVNAPFLNVKHKQVLKKITVDDSIINDDFFFNILYKKDTTQYSKLTNYIKKDHIKYGMYLLESAYNKPPTQMKRFKYNLNKLINWNEYIHIKPNIIGSEHINYITQTHTNDDNSELEGDVLAYVLKHIAEKVCDELSKTYGLDKTSKINIVKIVMSNNLTTSINNTIVGSVLLYNANIKHSKLNNQIEVKSGSIVFQNDEYTIDQSRVLEFILDVNAA